MDPDGNFHRIVNTCKWCPMDKCWTTQDGEKAPFWCTMLFFTGADGQCHIAPAVMHQATEVTTDLSLNLPDDWIVHATPSGCVDRDGWLKTVDNFGEHCNALEANPQFLFFDGHDSQ